MRTLCIYCTPFYLGPIKAFHYMIENLMYKPCKLTSTILELIFLLYIGLELNEPGGGWEQRVFNRIGIQNIVDDITF